MKEVTVSDAALREAAAGGMDAFIDVFVNAINECIGGKLTAETMVELNADQITLLAYSILRDEVMDGGFIQLIHNGYGRFFFCNPFARAVRGWGLDGLASLMNKARKLYNEYHKEIEIECGEEEFMALFERYPKFDEVDDKFVENEEEWTGQVAHYVDENIGRFAKIED